MADNKEGSGSSPNGRKTEARPAPASAKTQVRKREAPRDPSMVSAKDDPKLAAYKAFLEAQSDKKTIENSALISLIVFGAFLFITFPSFVQKLQGLERKDDIIEIRKQTVLVQPPEEQRQIREVKKETRQREFSQIPALTRPTGREEIIEDITDLNLEVEDELADMSWDLDSVKAPGPILVAGDITPPEFIPRGQKPYPQKARILRRTGNVRIEVIISKEGTLEEIKILRESPPDFGFGDAAITYLKQGQWKPALQNGRPIYARYIFTFNFTLN